MFDSILVIGSSGFIGKSLCKKLKEDNINYTSVDISGDSDYKINIVDEFNKLYDLINLIKPRSIINLAAISDVKQCDENPTLVYKLNVDFVDNLLTSCKKNNIKNFIQCSSEWIYGIGPLEINSTYHPSDFYNTETNLYAKSKLDSELRIFSRFKELDFNVFIPRFGIIYGNKENKSNCILDHILNNFSQNKKTVLRSDSAARCYISVDDICAALIKLSSINMKKEISPIIYDLQGPKCYQLSKIIDFLNNNDDFIKDVDLSNDKSDIKIIKSDFYKLMGYKPKCLSKYLMTYRNIQKSY